MTYAIIKNRRYSFILSAILVVASVTLLGLFGLKKGIDFTGGSLFEVKFHGGAPSAQDVAVSLETLNLGSVIAQSTDDDKMFIKLSFLSEDQHQQVLNHLRENFGSDPTFTIGDDGTMMEESPGITITEERFETIGSSISSQLRRRSWGASIAVILAIVCYIAYTFRRVSRPVAAWKFGVTAIIALVHDVLIVMGVFAVLGYLYGVEIGIPFVVALLTIMGYSVNDTIVVFDRVREHLIKRGSSKDFALTVDIGVSQSVRRSVNTSLTTLLVLLSLVLFGGDSVRYFALALTIGIFIGTYSSIFLASPLLVEWQRLGERKKA